MPVHESKRPVRRQIAYKGRRNIISGSKRNTNILTPMTCLPRMGERPSEYPNGTPATVETITVPKPIKTVLRNARAKPRLFQASIKLLHWGLKIQIGGSEAASTGRLREVPIIHSTGQVNSKARTNKAM